MIETILIPGLKYELRGITIEMGVYPVTQAQYQELMDENPSRFKGDDNPVEQVTWLDAVEFCEKLSQKTGKTYRLPAEYEWEFACRAGTTTNFSFGDNLSSEIANCENRYHSTTPVGIFPPNAFGLYDMHGNVWEWCLEHYSIGKTKMKPVRGGSWFDVPEFCSSSYRQTHYLAFRSCAIGFRVACEIQ